MLTWGSVRWGAGAGDAKEGAGTRLLGVVVPATHQLLTRYVGRHRAVPSRPAHMGCVADARCTSHDMMSCTAYNERHPELCS